MRVGQQQQQQTLGGEGSGAGGAVNSLERVDASLCRWEGVKGVESYASLGLRAQMGSGLREEQKQRGRGRRARRYGSMVGGGPSSPRGQATSPGQQPQPQHLSVTHLSASMHSTPLLSVCPLAARVLPPHSQRPQRCGTGR